jgi:predicted Fe-Mo cluster-binding NifX family protein
MKIAVTSQAQGLDALVDPRFGRARIFVIYDTETNKASYIDNVQNLNAAQGAGIQSAQTISKSGVKALITGHCGPKAFSALKAAGIKIYNAPETSVADALDLYKKGALGETSGANVESHW